MKIRTYILSFFLTVLLFTSCRTEETEFIETPEDEVLVANSSIAELMQRTAANDGSINNIIDKANCFDIVFPYVVMANSEQVVVNSITDFKTVECVFDASDADIDNLDIEFPITIIQGDFSEIEVTNLNQLNNFIANCNGENVNDTDIECLDFLYPIEASTFNANSEILETVTIERDNQLYNFITAINTSDIVTFNFPITTIDANGIETSITNFIALETAILNADNSCDEDDDYDYNDDDCNDCNTTQLENLLTNCPNWIVNRLKRDNTDYDDVYYNYNFNFLTDGTMSVSWNATTVFGTWSAGGNGNSLEVVIDVPSLPLCNNNWILQEVRTCSVETEVDFRLGNDNRLQYENICN
ncbi:hypothetical protein OAE07_03380 [Winogradskyella sp.]|nr:hypothetical protein [Winogradskyella sp.]